MSNQKQEGLPSFSEANPGNSVLSLFDAFKEFEENQLIEEIIQYGYMEGMLVCPSSTFFALHSKQSGNNNVISNIGKNDYDRVDEVSTKTIKQLAPIMVYPTFYPFFVYTKLSKIQLTINKLMGRLSIDNDFITKHIKPIAKIDEFYRNLFSIYEHKLDYLKENSSKDTKQVLINIFRSDYMLDCVSKNNKTNSCCEPKQIEINTIAASFMGLSSKVTEMHRYMFNDTIKNLKYRINENNCLDNVCKLLHAAYALFLNNNNQRNYCNEKTVIVMLVMQNERNICDQLMIVQKLKKEYGITIVRKTFSEMEREHRLEQNQETNETDLYIKTNLNNNYISNKESNKNEYKVAIVYYRTGYGPDDYTVTANEDSNKNKDYYGLRKLIEVSSCYKLPSIEMQLIGSKVIQEVMAHNDLTKYISKEEETELKSTFAKFTKLTNETKQEILQNDSNNGDMCEKLVLKPCREGGGHNYFGKDIAVKLGDMRDDELESYVLMERVNPKEFNSLGLSNNKVVRGKFVSELGIYGCYLAVVDSYKYKNKKGELILVNEQSGHLLRTKLKETNEGGVNTGYSMLDTPVMYS